MKTKAERIELARQEWGTYLLLAPEDRPFEVCPDPQVAREIDKGHGPIYSKIGHTKECQEANRRYREQVDAFIAAHPDHCEACGGWGGASSRGCSVPYGSTWVSLPDEWDSCPECTDRGLCPHCGKPLEDPDEPVRCAHCGWEDGQSDGIPGDGPGCLCPDLYLGWEDF